MKIDEVPVFKPIGVNESNVILCSDKGIEIMMPKKTIDLTGSQEFCLVNGSYKPILTKDGEKYLDYDESLMLLAKEVYYSENGITHAYNGKDFVCLISRKNGKTTHEYTKGNWMFTKLSELSVCVKVQHLGCCKYCSSTYEIIVETDNFKCYTDNEIYTDEKIITFTPNALKITNVSDDKYEFAVSFDKVKIYEFDKLTNDHVIMKCGTKIKLNTKVLQKFTNEYKYVETVGGFAKVLGESIYFKNYVYKISDILFVNMINNKISHVYTKEYTYCCVSNAKTDVRVTLDKCAWRLFSDGIGHLALCGNCNYSPRTKNISRIAGGYTAERAVFENSITKKQNELVNLVNNNGKFSLVQNNLDDIQQLNEFIRKKGKIENNPDNFDKTIDRFDSFDKTIESINSLLNAADRSERKKMIDALSNIIF